MGLINNICIFPADSLEWTPFFLVNWLSNAVQPILEAQIWRNLLILWSTLFIFLLLQLLLLLILLLKQITLKISTLVVAIAHKQTTAILWRICMNTSNI